VASLSELRNMISSQRLPGGEPKIRRKATADPSTRPGTPGLAQDDTLFLVAQDDKPLIWPTAETER
jgi:hypothetical protein